MIVYIDLVIISNLITDYAILKIIKEVWNEKIKIIRFIIALIFSIFNLLLFLFPFKKLMVLRYLSGIIIPLICFKYKTIKDSIIKVVTYYSLNILYIGIIVVFRINNYFMLVFSLLFVCASFILENYRNITIRENMSIEYVKIDSKKYIAYLDTGNKMYYKGIPIVILNERYYSNKFIYINNFLACTIGSKNIIKIYKGPLLEINNISNIVYYTFDNIDYDIILHNDLR